MINKILLVKTSSMGDVIHSFPAISDLKKALPDVQIDWLVEESFQSIANLHPGVNKVIPCAVRRWRKHIVKTLLSGEWARFKMRLNAQEYDLVIDAQGLLKSALLARLVKSGERHGLDKSSIREPIAARFYQHCHRVSWQQHAVERVRDLFAASVGYAKPDELDYQISAACLPAIDGSLQALCTEPFVVFIHATTWPDKHYPDIYWQELAKLFAEQGYKVLIPWVSEAEKQRAEFIGHNNKAVHVLPRLSLPMLAAVLVRAKLAVAVDTGLAHLCAALAVPTVSLYGPTDPNKIGAYGREQVFLSTTFALPSFAAALSRSGFAVPEATKVEPAVFAGLDADQVFSTCQQLLEAER